MFKTFFILIYCLLTAYIYLRAYHYIKHKPLYIKLLTLSTLCLCLILPFLGNLWAHQISHIWLFSFAYTVPLALGLHLFSAFNKKQRKPWFLLWIVLVLGTVIILYGYRQYKQINVVELEIPVEDSNAKPLTVVFASDLHFGYTITRPRAKEMMDAILAQNADLILLGGDIIDRTVAPVKKQKIEEEIRRLHAPYGVYSVMGNHEGHSETARRFIQDSGIKLLIDTAVQIPGAVNLIGRNDIGQENYKRSRQLDTVKPDDFRKPLSELKAMLPAGKQLPTILLDHVPKIPSVDQLDGIDLMLSGHTHNGQIFPFNLILKATNELSYGAKRKGNTQLYVSSGLGLWGARFRLGTQSEIVVVRFVPKHHKKVQVLFTSDMHSQLKPDRISGLGGFARLATAIEHAKREFNGPSVVLDAGDFSMGSKYHTLFTSGPAELPLMQQLGYDAVTLGNHEFDFTAAVLEKALGNIHDKATLNMLVMPNLSVAWPILGGPKTRIIKKCVEPGDTLRIGVFGIMGKGAIADAPTAEIKFSDPIEHAQWCVAELRRNRADLIVALSHNGLAKQNKENDLFLAKKVPGIDVIVSGHTHTLLKEPLRNTEIIVSPGSKAAYLGKLSLKKQGNHWGLLQYHLIPLDSTIPEAAKIKTEINLLKPAINRNYFERFGCTAETEVGYSAQHYPNLDELQSHFGDNPITQIITDAFVYAGEQWGCAKESSPACKSNKSNKSCKSNKHSVTTIGVLGMGNLRASLPIGNLYAEDIFNLLSFGSGPDGFAGFPLISVYLTKDEILTMCEIDANIGRRYGDFQLQFSGLKYASNAFRPFLNKVYRLQISKTGQSTWGQKNQTAKSSSTELYRVITNIYAAQRLSDVEKISHGLLRLIPKDEFGVPIRDIKTRILRTQNGSEVKEWWAVMQYLRLYLPLHPKTSLEIRKDTQPHGTWNSFRTLFGNYKFIGWVQLFILILTIKVAAFLSWILIRTVIRLFTPSRRCKHKCPKNT